jgi:GR25 family glycosyltransferase involved in LPS biosynthesis
MKAPLLYVYALLLVSGEEKCQWPTKKQYGSPTKPDIYYINMDKSRDRRVAMEAHLSEMGLSYHRIRGLPYQEIYIPDDIQKTWETRWCMLETEQKIPPRDSVIKDKKNPLHNMTAIMAGLCGRKRDVKKNKGNVPKELGCTSSHLIAMREAIYSESRSRYALIIEDDVQFPFDVDWEELARSAPAGFGILQLFNSNQASMEETWLKYLKKNKLWIQRLPMKFMDFWSTCAYLIDRIVMKPLVDSVIYEKDGWLQLKVIAGINGPCVPDKCCVASNSSNPAVRNDKFVGKPPCVWAPRGYQADSYLYAMTRTYMLSMPLITNGRGTNQSTFHQSHVSLIHTEAFKRQRQYINLMLTGKVPPPFFSRPVCKTIPVDS